jgi:hypothetical protein
MRSGRRGGINWRFGQLRPHGHQYRLEGAGREGERTKDLTPSMAPLIPPSLPLLSVQITTHSVQLLSGSAACASM